MAQLDRTCSPSYPGAGCGAAQSGPGAAVGGAGGSLGRGVLITNAWDMAVAASGSPALGRAVSTWKEPLENGATPAELVNQSREFPELFASLYQSGEISGQLDDALTRLHTHYQEEGTRKMRLIAKWTPKAIYLGVMLIVAWMIIKWAMAMYGPGSDLDNAIKGF